MGDDSSDRFWQDLLDIELGGSSALKTKALHLGFLQLGRVAQSLWAGTGEDDETGWDG